MTGAGRAEELRWRRADLLALGALILVGLLPRLFALGADPPIGTSPAFLFDEGWWAHNARNEVLFGRWVMDQHNPSLLVAPLYTWTLAGLYRLIGVGLAQTRALGAIAGFLSCVVLYAALRAERPLRLALPPALVLATSYFTVVQNRQALTESFQLLFVTATFAATLLAARRPAWAATAATSFVLALLAKPSAIVIAPALLAFWVLHWALGPRRPRLPAFRFRAPLVFAAVAAALSVAVGLLFVRPNWGPLQAQLAFSRLSVTGRTVGPREAFSHVGWASFGMTLNPFFVDSAVPIIAIALLAVSRHRPRRHGDGESGSVELLSWAWLGAGLAALAVQQFQPDRRFLLLMPAVAVLAARAFSGTLTLAGDGEDRPSLGATVWTGAWLGAWAGFLGYPLAQPFLGDRLIRLLPFLGPRGGANGFLLLAIAGGAAAAGLLGLATARRPVPGGIRIPGVALLVLFVIAEPGRFARYASHLTFTIRDASRWLESLTADWPPADRVMVGPVAGTLALETTLRPFLIRREAAGAENADGWARFHPALALLPAGQSPDPEIEAHGLVRCHRFAIWPDRAGRPSWRDLDLYVRPDRCPQPVAAASVASRPVAARSTSLDRNPPVAEPRATAPGSAIRHPVTQVPASR